MTVSTFADGLPLGTDKGYETGLGEYAEQHRAWLPSLLRS